MSAVIFAPPHISSASETAIMQRSRFTRALPESRRMTSSFTSDLADCYFFFFLAFAFCLSSTTTCAAASRAIGTRNGEALT